MKTEVTCGRCEGKNYIQTIFRGKEICDFCGGHGKVSIEKCIVTLDGHTNGSNSCSIYLYEKDLVRLWDGFKQIGLVKE